jgi:hypothetical protein
MKTPELTRPDMNQSDNKLLHTSLEHKTLQADAKSFRLGFDEFQINAIYQTISHIEKLINSLSYDGDEQEFDAIKDLEYMIRLLHERADLMQEKKQHMKIKSETYPVKNEIEEGDEWKEKTEYNKKENTKTETSYIPKSQDDKEALYSMNLRISEIDEELDTADKQFSQNHPALDLILTETMKNNPFKNSTN